MTAGAPNSVGSARSVAAPQVVRGPSGYILIGQRVVWRRWLKGRSEHQVDRRARRLGSNPAVLASATSPHAECESPDVSPRNGKDDHYQNHHQAHFCPQVVGQAVVFVVDVHGPTSQPQKKGAHEHEGALI
jgi:hypothetical protein